MLQNFKSSPELEGIWKGNKHREQPALSIQEYGRSVRCQGPECSQNQLVHTPEMKSNSFFYRLVPIGTSSYVFYRNRTYAQFPEQTFICNLFVKFFFLLNLQSVENTP